MVGRSSSPSFLRRLPRCSFSPEPTDPQAHRPTGPQAHRPTGQVSSGGQLSLLLSSSFVSMFVCLSALPVRASVRPSVRSFVCLCVCSVLSSQWLCFVVALWLTSSRSAEFSCLAQLCGLRSLFVCTDGRGSNPENNATLSPHLPNQHTTAIK